MAGRDDDVVELLGVGAVGARSCAVTVNFFVSSDHVTMRTGELKRTHFLTPDFSTRPLI